MIEEDNFFDIKPKRCKPKVGSVLISEPLLEDFYFKRSVVFILDYNEEGAMGIVLNKPVFIDFSDVVPDIVVKPFPLYSGGPVELERIFFLHQLGSEIAQSEEIIKGVFWSGKEQDIQRVLSNPQFDENSIRAFIGYSGWNPGQLEKEIAEGRWVVADIQASTIFSEDYSKMWENSVKLLNECYHKWINYPKNPQMN